MRVCWHGLREEMRRVAAAAMVVAAAMFVSSRKAEKAEQSAPWKRSERPWKCSERQRADKLLARSRSLPPAPSRWSDENNQLWRGAVAGTERQ